MSDQLFWHFLADNRRLRYGDNREVKPGETLTVTCEPILCSRGLHACARPLDALSYAPGSIICLVRLGGEIAQEEGENKVSAQERTAVWIYDASRLLWEFACDIAEEALLAERSAGREPHPASFAAIEVMRRFMNGEASEDERSAAYSAAYSAANSAANSAAYRAADRAADRAAYSAADSAARDRFNDKLLAMLLAAKDAGEGEFAAVNDPYSSETIVGEAAQ